MIQFKRITYEDTKPFLLKKHYAHRMPSISFAFGLYKDDELHGVLTFGITSGQLVIVVNKDKDTLDCTKDVWYNVNIKEGSGMQ